MRIVTVLLIAATLGAASCASGPRRVSDQELHDRYRQYAGEPVRSFTYLGRYDNWQPLGNDSVVVWTTFYNAYLLKLRQPCNGLQFTQRIGLTSTNQTVSAGFDFVKFKGWQTCWIDEIRPVDYRRMQADQRAARQKAKQSTS
jgi:hypothetical protein